MCYLIAKDTKAHGCYAWKTTHGKKLVQIKKTLDQAVGYMGVQMVVISRPTAYGGIVTRGKKVPEEKIIGVGEIY